MDMKCTDRIRAYFESFRVKIFLIIVSIMTALALITTISMYLMATKSLMNQAATITETNMKLEISVVNSIFHSVEYYAKEMAVSEELRELCSADDQWDYQTAAEKYRQVKTFAEQKMTSLERNNLINSNITIAIYIFNQKTVFDIKSTFYENVKSENISFLKDYEERLDHWVSTPRVNGVNLYPSGMTEKYPETMVSKCFPIMDDGGKKIGVLAAQVNSAVFENYFSDTQKGLSGETIVIDETGLPVLYSNRRLYEYFSECLDENLEMSSRWKTIKLGAKEYMLIQGTEKAESAKLILMLERYAGESVQLPPHEGIDDTLYGSFAVYRQEVIEELRAYVVNNSFEALDDQMETAIANSKDPGKFSQIWKVVKAKVKADIHNPLYLP